MNRMPSPCAEYYRIHRTDYTDGTFLFHAEGWNGAGLLAETVRSAIVKAKACQIHPYTDAGLNKIEDFYKREANRWLKHLEQEEIKRREKEADDRRAEAELNARDEEKKRIRSARAQERARKKAEDARLERESYEDRVKEKQRIDIQYFLENAHALEVKANKRRRKSTIREDDQPWMLKDFEESLSEIDSLEYAPQWD